MKTSKTLQADEIITANKRASQYNLLLSTRRKPTALISHGSEKKRRTTLCDAPNAAKVVACWVVFDARVADALGDVPNVMPVFRRISEMSMVIVRRASGAK